MARRGSSTRTTSVREFGDAKAGRRVTTVTDGRKVHRTTVDRSEGPGGVRDTTTTEERQEPQAMSPAEQFVTLLVLLGGIGVYLHYRPGLQAFWARIVAAKGQRVPVVPATSPSVTLPPLPKVPGVTPVPAIIPGAVALPIK